MSDERDPIEVEAAEAVRRISARHRRPAADRAEALERARAAGDPETAALRHGLWMRDGMLMLCDRCPCARACEFARPGERCLLERSYVERRAAQMRAVLLAEGHDPLLHEALTTAAIWAEVRLGRAMRQTAVAGEFTGDRGYTGVAREIPALQRAVSTALDALNLTPHAIAKLEAQRAAASQGVHPYASMADPLDAEFVAADEAADGDLTPQPPSPSGADGAPSGEGGCECGRGDGSDE